ncbi:MAG: pilus assembly protein [Myxococcales bacterium]|nr:pilus assembly protein [Myxococcales bacterium]
MTKGTTSLRRDQRGAAYAEFLIAFPPVLILFLCLVQLSLMYVGKLAVRHAANRAARAAVVVLPDDPAFYEGERINQIDYDGSGSATQSDSFFGAGAISGGGSPRIRAIRSAAYTPLTPLAPSLETVMDDESVRTAFDRGALDALAGGFLFNRGATAVSFPRTPGEQNFRDRFESRELVTTRVTYLFNCGVPIVNRFMCDSALELLMAAPSAVVDGVLGALGADTRDGIIGRGFDWYRDNLEGRAAVQNGVVELRYAEAPALIAPWAATGGRFIILRAEAVMPNQGAGFEYE